MGGITKEGRSELRIAMVEAAWVAIEHHPHWKGEFERLSVRIGDPKAIVAIARKLLVAVWHVLSQKSADIHADVQAVAARCTAFPRAVAQLPASRRFRLCSCVTTWISWDLEKVSKKFTTVVASIASKMRTRKRKDLKLSSCPFSQACLSLPRCFSLSRQEPYRLLRFATQVLIGLSMRGLQLLGLIEGKKWDGFLSLDLLSTSVLRKIFSCEVITALIAHSEVQVGL